MTTYESLLHIPQPLDASRILLFDGHSLLYRAFYAIPALTTKSGVPVNAIYGFWRVLLRALRDFPSAYVAVVFDAEGKNFRHVMYEDYKATRKPMPEDLVGQLPQIIEMLTALGIPVLREEGVEADDVLASVAHQAELAGLRSLISTSDKDMAQIVTGRTSLLRPTGRGEGGTLRCLGPTEVKEKYGVPPDRIVDLYALVGDTSDNVPGVPGVGEKTAAKLLEQYDTLEEILAHADGIRNKRVRESLLESGDAVFLSRDLIRLKTDLPLDDVRTLCRLRGPDLDDLSRFFTAVEFQTVLEELGLEPAPLAPLETVLSIPADYRCILNEPDLNALIDRLRRAERISIDLETTDLDPMRAKIVGIAVSPAPHLGYYIPVGHNALGAPGQLPLENVLHALHPILEKPSPAIIGQNLKYDITILARHGVSVDGVDFDAMIASHLIHPEERRHNLDEIARTYLDYQTITYADVAGKNGAFAAVSVEEATRYAAEDAEIIQRLYPVLTDALRLAGAQTLFAEIELPLIQVLSRMERNGILVDCEVLAQQGAELRKELEIVESDLFDIAGVPFNPSSPKQVAEILFERLGLPIVTRTKTGPSTSARVLAELAVQHPFPGKLMVHRELQKLLSTYIEQLPQTVHPETGRIHTHYHQTGTATGRLSSSEPNLQNIPTRSQAGGRIRQAFVAPDGSVLLSADYSQIELRLLAHLSGDENLIAAFESETDLHRLTASRVFGVPPERVTAAERDAAKRINFGILYGISPFGLARELNSTQSDARTYIDRFFAAYPRAKAFLDELVDLATKKGYAETLLGLRRPLPDLRSKNQAKRNFDRRNAVNTPIQGSAADLIKKAMIDIDRIVRGEQWPAKMLLQIHDELVFEVPAAAADEFTHRVRAAMEGVLDLRVPLKVKTKTGRNWAEI